MLTKGIAMNKKRFLMTSDQYIDITNRLAQHPQGHIIAVTLQIMYKLENFGQIVHLRYDDVLSDIQTMQDFESQPFNTKEEYEDVLIE